MPNPETEAANRVSNELFADLPRLGLGALSIRHMFGGAGLYAGKLFFACIFKGEIYLRADEAFACELAAEGSIQFTWENPKTGRELQMHYWRIPEAALDSPDRALDLAARSLGLAAAAKRTVRRRN